MRTLRILLLILLLVSTASAQISYSTITGTVTDGSGNPLANANIVATLVMTNGIQINGLATPNGQLYNGSPAYGTLDSAGHFSLNLAPNAILSKPNGAPIMTQWLLRISAPQDAAILTWQQNWNVSYQFTVTGNQDLSTQLSALVTAPIAFVNTKTGQSTFSGNGGGIWGRITGTLSAQSDLQSTLNAKLSLTGGALSGLLTAPNFNNILTAGTVQYPTIASAIAALPSGGIVMTPPYYTETFSSLDIGSASQQIAVIAGKGTILTVNGGTGSMGVQIFNGSVLSCADLSGQSCHLVSASTGVPRSLVRNGQQDGTQEYFNLFGWFIDGRAAPSFTDGVVYVNGVFVPSSIENNIILGPANSIGLHVTSTIGASGGTNVLLLKNNWINCANNAGCRSEVIDRSTTITGSVTSGTFTAGETVTQAVTGATGKVYIAVPPAGPLQIVSRNSSTPDATDTWTGGTSGAVFTPTAAPSDGVISQITQIGGAVEHSGIGNYNIEINGGGSTFQNYGIDFQNVQSEGNTGTSQTVADMYIVDAQNVSISGFNCSHHASTPCVELNQTVLSGLSSITLSNIRGSANGPAVKNDITGYSTTTNKYLQPYYFYSDNLNSTSAVFDGPTRFVTPADQATDAYNPAVTLGTNMLVSGGIDPSFETGSSTLGTGWTSQCNSDPGCSFTRDGTTAAPGLGTYSQKVTVADQTSADQLHATNASWTITAGNTYVISFWAKNDGGPIQGTMSLQDHTATVSYCPVEYIALTSSWPTKPFTFTCTATVSGTDVMLRLQNRLNTGTGSMWFDGVQLAPGTSPPYTGFGTLAVANVDGITTQLSNGQISVKSIASGSGYALPDYPSASSPTLAPSNIKTDSTGNNLSIPGAVSTGSTPPTACGSAVGCSAQAEAGTAGTPTAGQQYCRADSLSHKRLCSVNGSPEAPVGFVLSGTTASIGGSALAAGACATGTVTITNAAVGMDAHATPSTYPGAAFEWNAYVSAANTVTVSVCTNLAAGGTPTASVYNVRVTQ